MKKNRILLDKNVNDKSRNVVFQYTVHCNSLNARTLLLEC